MLGAAILPATSANAAACRAFVEGSAEGTFQTPTEIVARMYWRSEVRDRFGGGYVFWSKAQEKTTRCYKSEPGAKWHCVARARPCD
jgi:hypothetical protein